MLELLEQFYFEIALAAARAVACRKDANAASAVTTKDVTDASEIVTQEIAPAGSMCDDRPVSTQSLSPLVRLAGSPATSAKTAELFSCAGKHRSVRGLNFENIHSQR